MEGWLPRDGDVFIAREGFVFYVFGYERPVDRVFSFLKYIPTGLQSLFGIRYLRRRWKLGERTLVRAEKLYTARNYGIMLETLRMHFPDYVYFCPYRRKMLISAHAWFKIGVTFRAAGFMVLVFFFTVLVLFWGFPS
jgi:hypothetical protein